MSSVSTRAVVGVQGTCEEEVQRIEAFLDTVMGRTQGAAQRVAANEALWKGQGIPWDAAIFASVRANSLHLATLYMSRQGPLTLRQDSCLFSRHACHKDLLQTAAHTGVDVLSCTGRMLASAGMESARNIGWPFSCSLRDGTGCHRHISP